MENLVGKDFVLRETSGEDLALLLPWHADPEIYRYWERRPLTEEEIREKYLGGRSPEVVCFIIESVEAAPLGFIQYAHLDEGDIGLDMFLVPAARGHGLGPRVARYLAEYLLREHSARRVTVDPLVSNEAAVRAWARAGFKEVGRIESGDHGEPAILMEFEA